MEPLKISEYPDGILRKKCASIERITDSEVKLFEEMLFTMRHFAGIGLAAPQIGIVRNLIVADIGEGAIKLANPTILKVKGSDKNGGRLLKYSRRGCSYRGARRNYCRRIK